MLPSARNGASASWLLASGLLADNAHKQFKSLQNSTNVRGCYTRSIIMKRVLQDEHCFSPIESLVTMGARHPSLTIRWHVCTVNQLIAPG